MAMTVARRNGKKAVSCPVESTIAAIGGRWKVLVIHRHVHRQIPRKVEYSLTPLGRELEPVLYAMHAWGEKLDGTSKKSSHRQKEAVPLEQVD